MDSNTASSSLPQNATPLRTRLRKSLKEIEEQCTDCGACMRHCAFLKQHGSLLTLVRQLELSTPEQVQISFGCSLCGLCTTVCPQKLDPCGLFLDLRRHRAAMAPLELTPYKALLFYERLGASKLFSLFHLPPGCTTIFFPGCALPGTRPAVTHRLFAHLQSQNKNLGLVLTCCTKPSHDLGRSDVFQNNFQAIKKRLLTHHITTVLTACPNCTAIFRQYAPELSTENIFSLLAEFVPAPIDNPHKHQEVVVHDPCPLRGDRQSQEAARTIVSQLGYTIRPMAHQQNKTLCCGEGGAVGCVQPQLATSWTQKRIAQAQGRTIITTCGGCSAMFARFTAVLHLADLLFGKYVGNSPQPKISKPPMTYLNRLLLKLRYSWRVWWHKKAGEN